MPVEVEPGAEVAGATINTYGRLVVRATKVGAETALAQIARLVAEAQAGQGADPASRRPHLGSVRPGRAGDRPRDPRRLACGHGQRRRCLHRGSRRADHRLPVRTRSRDADGADGRHRPRSAARHPDQGARSPRADAAHRHGRPRQDGHRHGREDGARRRRAAQRRDAGGRSSFGRCGRSGERASDRPRDRRTRRGARLGSSAARHRLSATFPASASTGVVEGQAVEVARRDGAITVSWDGVSRGQRFVVRDTVKPTSARGRPAVGGARPDAGAPHRRRRAARRAASPPRSGSTA